MIKGKMIGLRLVHLCCDEFLLSLYRFVLSRNTFNLIDEQGLVGFSDPTKTRPSSVFGGEYDKTYNTFEGYRENCLFEHVKSYGLFLHPQQ